jgi:glycosyltransferase involved in cell wall biosynthesis
MAHPQPRRPMETHAAPPTGPEPAERALDTPAGGLRICLLSYRSNPHSGGQGVYIKNLSRALRDLGHRVTVMSGPPELPLAPGIRRVPLHGLDLYNPADPFRLPRLRELADPINIIEWLGVSSMGFPEPYTFGLRVLRHFRRREERFDVLHDNQSLSYGVRALSRRWPTLVTIHHPVTVDRRMAVREQARVWAKLKQWRWYSFIGMQKRVARGMNAIITVSESARRDISRDFGIPAGRLRVIPNGIDTELFHPLPGIPREPGRIIVTNSADMPLKGLAYLLRALPEIRRRRRGLRLVVIGSPRPGGTVERLVGALGIGDAVEFTGRITEAELVRHYARAWVAVVPSVYEGFGLPAGEAMACAVPVVSTRGGALPEVVGDAGLLVPPADPPALAAAVLKLLADPGLAERLGRAGWVRAHRCFSWRLAAERTVSAYREVMDAHRRPRSP